MKLDELIRNSSINFDELFFDYLCNRIGQKVYDTKNDTTYGAYDQFLNLYSTSFGIDEQKSAESFLFAYIDLDPASQSNESHQTTIKELLLIVLEHSEPIFFISEHLFLLFVDIMQALLAKRLRDSTVKLMFHTIEPVFYKLNKYFDQVFIQSAHNRNDMISFIQCDNGVLVRLVEFIRFLNGLLETFDSQSEIELSLREYMSNFLINWFHEPFINVLANDDDNEDDEKNDYLERLHELFRFVSSQIVKLNVCHDLIRLVQHQLNHLVDKEKNESDWTKQNRPNSLAIVTFVYVQLDLARHIRPAYVLDSIEHDFNVPDVYSHNHIIINVYLPALMCLLHELGPNTASHLGKCLTRMLNRFVNAMELRHTANSMLIDTQTLLVRLMRLFEMAFRTCVYSDKQKVRTTAYKLVSILFACLCKRDQHLILKYFLHRTCQYKNKSASNREYLRLSGNKDNDGDDNELMLMDDQNEMWKELEHIYDEDAFNCYLSSYCIYLFKESVNKELVSIKSKLQQVDANNSLDDLVYFHLTSCSTIQLSQSFCHLFNLIFNVNYMRLDHQVFVNDFILKLNILIKNESKVLAQLNLLRYLFIANELASLKETLKRMISSTNFLIYLNDAIEKVHLNYEMEKKSLLNDTNMKSVSSIEFKIDVMHETTNQSDERLDKLDTLNKSLRTLDLIKSLHVRLCELIEIS